LCCAGLADVADYAGIGFFVCRIFAKFAFYSWLAGWCLPLHKQSFSVHLKRTGEEVYIWLLLLLLKISIY
jgi:hypothetical protein